MESHRPSANPDLALDVINGKLGSTDLNRLSPEKKVKLVEQIADKTRTGEITGKQLDAVPHDLKLEVLNLLWTSPNQTPPKRRNLISYKKPIGEFKLAITSTIAEFIQKKSTVDLEKIIAQVAPKRRSLLFTQILSTCVEQVPEANTAKLKNLFCKLLRLDDSVDKAAKDPRQEHQPKAYAYVNQALINLKQTNEPRFTQLIQSLPASTLIELGSIAAEVYTTQQIAAIIRQLTYVICKNVRHLESHEAQSALQTLETVINTAVERDSDDKDDSDFGYLEEVIELLTDSDTGLVKEYVLIPIKFLAHRRNFDAALTILELLGLPIDESDELYEPNE